MIPELESLTKWVCLHPFFGCMVNHVNNMDNKESIVISFHDFDIDVKCYALVKTRSKLSIEKRACVQQMEVMINYELDKLSDLIEKRLLQIVEEKLG